MYSNNVLAQTRFNFKFIWNKLILWPFNVSLIFRHSIKSCITKVMPYRFEQKNKHWINEFNKLGAWFHHILIKIRPFLKLGTNKILTLFVTVNNRSVIDWKMQHAERHTHESLNKAKLPFTINELNKSFLTVTAITTKSELN